MTGVGSSTPTYDANGNATNDTSQTYAWDAAGHAVTINAVGLTYDALGRMVEQSKGANFFQIVYTPRGSKFAIMKGSTLTNAFVSLTGGAQAVYIGSGLQYYRHSDWLGSSRFASKTNQTLYADTAYAPFGEAYAQSGTSDVSFTGMNQDTVSNLYDFMYREYDPTQGRWPSPDPAGLTAANPGNPQSWNRYSYVLNNPLALVDPNGLDCIYYEGDNVIVQRGDCTSDTDNGIFVDVTINLDSFTYNNQNQSIGFNVTNDNTGAPGALTILGIDQQPNSVMLAYNPPDDVIMTQFLLPPGNANNMFMSQTHWYNTCTAKAIGNGLLHGGVDAIGLIPEGGIVSRAIGHFAGWGGIVATQQGTKALQGIKLGAGIGSTGLGLNDTSATGLLSTGLAIVGFIPGAGQVTSIGSILVDTYNTAKAIGQCH